MPDADFPALQQVPAGRYSPERELGRGSVGIVDPAREVRRDRPVAIEVLPPAPAAGPGTRERLLREAVRAPAHAQAQGIVHRDVRPDDVLPVCWSAPPVGRCSPTPASRTLRAVEGVRTARTLSSPPDAIPSGAR